MDKEKLLASFKVVEDKSEKMLQAPGNIARFVGRDLVMAKEPPAVEFAVVPAKPLFFAEPPAGNHVGPWSNWSQAVFHAKTGKFYSSVGDHGAYDAHTYIVEYDPASKTVRCLPEINHVLGRTAAVFGEGKIHGWLDFYPQGSSNLWFCTYWAKYPEPEEQDLRHGLRRRPHHEPERRDRRHRRLRRARSRGPPILTIASTPSAASCMPSACSASSWPGTSTPRRPLWAGYLPDGPGLVEPGHHDRRRDGLRLHDEHGERRHRPAFHQVRPGQKPGLQAGRPDADAAGLRAEAAGATQPDAGPDRPPRSRRPVLGRLARRRALHLRPGQGRGRRTRASTGPARKNTPARWPGARRAAMSIIFPGPTGYPGTTARRSSSTTPRPGRRRCWRSSTRIFTRSTATPWAGRSRSRSTPKAARLFVLMNGGFVDLEEQAKDPDSGHLRPLLGAAHPHPGERAGGVRDASIPVFFIYYGWSGSCHGAPPHGLGIRQGRTAMRP